MAHEQHWSSIVCLLWWSSILSSFVEVNVLQNHVLLSFSLPLLNRSFYFLSSILLGFSKCLISQNVGCLIKTPLNKNVLTFFQGSSPWATLIFNSYVCCGGFLLCPVFPLKSFFQNPFLFSFAIASVSYLVQFSLHPLLDFYGVSMVFQKKIYGNSMEFQLCFCDILYMKSSLIYRT